MYWTTGLNATAYQSLTVNGVPQFQAANPAAGVPAGTSFTAQWFNDVQGEPLNIVLAAGITPVPNTPTQVLQGLRRIFGGNVTIIDQATTLTLDQMGFIELLGSVSYVTVLPTPVGGNVNPPITIWNNSGATQTLSTPAGEFYGPGGNGENQLAIAAGQIARVRSDTANYIVDVIAPLTTSQVQSLIAASQLTVAELEGDFAALNGSPSEVFAVAAPTAASDATPWGQVFGGSGATTAQQTGNYSPGVVYYNTTPRAIQIHAQGGSAGVGTNLTVTVNGVVQGSAGQPNTGSAQSVCGTVLPGQPFIISGSFSNLVVV